MFANNASPDKPARRESFRVETPTTPKNNSIIAKLAARFGTTKSSTPVELNKHGKSTKKTESLIHKRQKELTDDKSKYNVFIGP